MKRLSREKRFDIMVYVLVLLICAVLIFPLLYIVFMSLSSPSAIYYGEVTFFPKDFSVESYIYLFKRSDIFLGYWNTIKLVVIGTLLSIVLTFTLAYPLSRRDLKGRRFITVVCVITMFFSGGLVPLFLVVQALKIYNTMWAMILPCAVSVWNVIVVRTFITASIPTDLTEAAFIDGASNFRTFIQIIIPLCKPVIAIMILFYGVGYWNSYFYPLVFLSPSNTAAKPLQLIMQDILLSDGGFVGGESALEQRMMAEAVKYSSIIITTIPILAVYPFLAKHLEKGMMIGSVKG